MFPGFTARHYTVPGGEIYARVGGAGPALVLLHGYPQTSAMWRHVAPALAERFLVICPDLRGYGRSFKPPTTEDHAPYSKRAMAGDILALADQFGAETFDLVGHDRGGRVAHRLAADAEARVRSLAVLDIAPTQEMYAGTHDAFARAYWHWFFLIRPAPGPERMIGADPDAFWEETCTALSGAQEMFEDAREEYLRAFRDPMTIHAACEDYRAAATVDLRHDAAEEGKLAVPLFVLWGDAGTVGRLFDPIALWQQRAQHVIGKALPTGHFMAEEAPEAVLQELNAWLDRRS